MDSLEEFRVTTTNADADSGRSSGAQVSLVTKSGTNQFHGSAYEYNRTLFGAANDWFNKQAELSSGLPHKPGELIRNTFGDAVGGPIIKDRPFFFANYEGQRSREAVADDASCAQREFAPRTCELHRAGWGQRRILVASGYPKHDSCRDGLRMR